MLDNRYPLATYDKIAEHIGLLFAAATPFEMMMAWVMAIAIAGFPLWFIGSSVYAAVKKRWFWFHPAALLATCFNAGHIRPAPGTWGTLFGVWAFVWLLFAPRETTMNSDDMLKWLFIITAMLIPVGTWASGVYAKRTKKDDPKEVVIDEVAGLWLTISIAVGGFIGLVQYDAMQFTPMLLLWPFYLCMIFLLFRVFDVWKPWVIGWADKNLKGGWGIMADDLLAGVFAGVVFWLIFVTLHYSGGFVMIVKTFFPDWVGPAPEVDLQGGR